MERCPGVERRLLAARQRGEQIFVWKERIGEYTEHVIVASRAVGSLQGGWVGFDFGPWQILAASIVRVALVQDGTTVARGESFVLLAKFSC